MKLSLSKRLTLFHFSQIHSRSSIFADNTFLFSHACKLKSFADHVYLWLSFDTMHRFNVNTSIFTGWIWIWIAVITFICDVFPWIPSINICWRIRNRRLHLSEGMCFIIRILFTLLYFNKLSQCLVLNKMCF